MNLENENILSSLARTESSGDFRASNQEMGAGGMAGHFGRLQFGRARLQDAERAGVLPSGTTPDQFMADPALQQRVEAWHLNDMRDRAVGMGLDQYIGQNVGGVPITMNSILAMGHLGGMGGAQRYLESGGRSNPSDVYGTSLRDYALTHGDGVPQATISTRGAPQMAMQPTQPQGLLGQLGIQRRDPTAQGETALPFFQRDQFRNTMGNLAMAFNTLRRNPDENIPRIVTGQRATREQDVANNRTVEWLSSQPGGERFAGLVESIGAAAALQAYQAEVARTSQPPSAAEAQIARLVASGLPYEVAAGIVDDRFVESRDPVTGEATVLDLAQEFLNPEGAEAPVDTATPADTSPDLFGEYTFDSLQNALGIGGAIDSVINRVYEGFGEELPNEEVAAARVGLQNLATRTQLIYASAFPGRPSNLTREMIASLTVRPDEILSGAQTARERAEAMQLGVARSVEGAQAVLDSRTSPAEKAAARDVLLRLEPLAQDYASLVNALSRTGASEGPAAGLDAALNRYPGAGQ